MQVPREGWRCWVCPGGVPTPSASSWHPRVAWASDSPPQVSCIRTTSPICRESWGTPLPWKLYMAVKWNGTERQPGETSGYQESLLLPALPFLTLSDDHAAHMAKQNQRKTNVKTTDCHRSQCRPSLAPKGPHSLVKHDLSLAQVMHSSLSNKDGIYVIPMVDLPLYTRHVLSTSSHSIPKATLQGVNCDPILQIRKWRCLEVKQFGQNHEARKWQENQYLTSIFSTATVSYLLLPNYSILVTAA